VRRISRLDGDLEETGGPLEEMECRPLEQDPASQPAGSLPGYGTHDAVQLRTGEMKPRSELVASGRLVEACSDRFEERPERVGAHALILPPATRPGLIVLGVFSAV